MSNDSLYEFLKDHCLAHDVRQYLEIGTREGDSLRVVLGNSINTLEAICCADMWGTAYGGSGRGSHWHIEKMLDLFGYEGRRTFLNGNSRDTVPKLMQSHANAFDLILVDGDHSYEGGMADLENVWPLLRPGGCVVFHDITHPAHPYLMACFDAFIVKAGAIREVISADYGVGIAWKR